MNNTALQDQHWEVTVKDDDGVIMTDSLGEEKRIETYEIDEPSIMHRYEQWRDSCMISYQFHYNNEMLFEVDVDSCIGISLIGSNIVLDSVTLIRDTVTVDSLHTLRVKAFVARPIFLRSGIQVSILSTDYSGFDTIYHVVYERNDEWIEFIDTVLANRKYYIESKFFTNCENCNTAISERIFFHN